MWPLGGRKLNAQMAESHSNHIQEAVYSLVLLVRGLNDHRRAVNTQFSIHKSNVILYPLTVYSTYQSRHRADWLLALHSRVNRKKQTLLLLWKIVFKHTLTSIPWSTTQKCCFPNATLIRKIHIVSTGRQFSHNWKLPLANHQVCGP